MHFILNGSGSYNKLRTTMIRHPEMPKRTIEFPHGASFIKVEYCLKVLNAHKIYASFAIRRTIVFMAQENSN